MAAAVWLVAVGAISVAACMVAAPVAAAKKTSYIATSGAKRVWHPMVLTLYGGPWASESAANNPFLNYRLTTTFTSGASGRKYVIPCFWAADGRAAQSGATAGSVWRCLFTPDVTGPWRWSVSFKSGTNVAVRPGAGGAPVSPFDGQTGSFWVRKSNKTGRDFRGKGRLRPVAGKRHLRHDNGEWFMKHGADSPENFLGYSGFDNTPKARHHYASHRRDWRAGDPTWAKDRRGKAIVGAVNYLASAGVNSIYAMPMTVGGDAKDTWPWTTERGMWRYDVSKLSQWQILFEHMNARGVALHFVLSETENEELFERADRNVKGRGFSDARRLYYRELVARFGHLQGITWNLGEENGWLDGSGQVNTDGQRKAFLEYFSALEPYGALLALHTYPADKTRVYTPLLGKATPLTGASLQVAGWPNVHKETLQWVHASQRAGKPWVVSVDEIGGKGALPDAETPDHDRERRDVLWGALTAGAAGVEWYYQAGDQSLENFRGHANLWKTTDRAMRLLREQRVPYWAMNPADWLVDGKSNWALANSDVILAYLPWGGRARVRLAPSSSYKVGWFDPRIGGSTSLRGVRTIQSAAGGMTTIGSPPWKSNRDWALLVRREGSSSAPPLAPAPTKTPPPPPTAGSGPFAWFVVDADTAKDVKGPLAARVTFRRSDLPANFSIRVIRRKGMAGPGGVRFVVNGATERVEGLAPFFIAGDWKGKVFPWKKAPCGKVTLAAVATVGGARSTVEANIVC